MKRFTQVTLISLVLLFVTQCAIIDARRNLKNCNFSLEDVAIKNMSLSGVDLEFQIGIDNPNPSAVVMDKLDMDIFLKDQNIGKGQNETRVEVPAGEKRTIKLGLKSSYAQLGTALMSSLRSDGPIPYKLQGTAHLQIPLVGGSVPFPFSVEDELQR